MHTDYLIVGCGALGMSAADQLLEETDATIVMVDRRHAPGGHWNDAYPFVRLHQPSAFYGTGSRQLGANRIDETGFNAGYYELASGPELLCYFDGLMRERFLPSDRVRYFPMSEHQGDGRVVSLLSGEVRTIEVRKKTIDATFFNAALPSTHPPAYAVADGVRVVPPNALPSEAPRFARYTLVGGGKTAMDAGVWLLQHGARPDAIRWIAPRASWLINRETTQPGEAFFHRFIGSRAAQLEASAAATSVEDLFDRLEASGQLLRIDRHVRPTMYRGATISVAEVALLSAIGDVVRMGRVRRIERDRVVLEHGEMSAATDTLYIDCSANALGTRPAEPVFSEGRITIQMVRAGLLTLSAAVIAHMEAAYAGDAEKNYLCPPIPVADTHTDWLRLTLADLEVQRRWAADPSLKRWVQHHRLSGSPVRAPDGGQPDPEALAIRQRIRDASAPARANLERLLQT
ncbi:MAG: NAD(P)/FAD-dependent oxidoreductase [Alphaproteobacteria bacterium]|nr:NAD(P)/FAD-dependent oxidoreductase [Alphaproteobacteria bacterium]